MPENNASQKTDISIVQTFIKKWEKTEASELGNSQPFLIELCDLLKQPHPEGKVSDESKNLFVFEKDVVFVEEDGSTSNGRIDLYKEGCFVLESKQGSEQRQQEKDKLRRTPPKKRIGMAPRGTQAWRDAMKRAKRQAERYARALPEWPPFLIVVDVGFVFRLYADFKRLGKVYQQYPSPTEFEFRLHDLERQEIRDLLVKIWTDPMSLDPEAKATKATREVADQLARLARSLEKDGHDPQLVAEFLMRLLFTMYAEDVGMLPRDSFTEMLKRHANNPRSLLSMLESLWTSMNKGGFSVAIEADVLEFNGQFFSNPKVLPLDEDQVAMLIETAELDWQDVEPAIFGTLIERALDPAERHKLGAHYTPRAYVERLVNPTIMQPLEAEWLAVQAAAAERMHEAEDAEDSRTRISLEKKAADLVRGFHRKLLDTRVLDPACGSGNFLYVTFELMKRLESEVLQELAAITGLGGQIQAETEPLDPKNFLGIEINPRAAAVAELVLWLGFLKWHFATSGKSEPRQPVLRAYRNIECRDAILAYDKRVLKIGDDGKTLTEWDGVTMKKHPVTGKNIPDDTARSVVYDYINPREAKWPEADYIIGNPPYVGYYMMKGELGPLYTDYLRYVYKEIPDSCDYVMYWWDKAALMESEKKIKQFGFITTNSIQQIMNSKVIQKYLHDKNVLSIVFAISNHPWVEGSDSADVTVTMTVTIFGSSIPGTLIVYEHGKKEKRSFGIIGPRVNIGIDPIYSKKLQSNKDIASRGVVVNGNGFILDKEAAYRLGYNENNIKNKIIKKYVNGKDITDNKKPRYIIDLYSFNIDDIRSKYPKIYQWIYDNVRPQRLVNKRKSRRENWWLFGEPLSKMRPALKGLNKYIVSTDTAKHRVFQFLEGNILPDHKIVFVASDSLYLLGVLSSRIHVLWTLSTGGLVGPTPVYSIRKSFCCFPFPTNEIERISSITEKLEFHRKKQLEIYDDLKLTDIYNVLEKLKAENQSEKSELSINEKEIYDKGLVGVLKQLHEELDEAVFDAYGWKHDLSDEEILENLVALNLERYEEEQRGTIRWLRPEFQAPKQSGVQQEMECVAKTTPPKIKGEGVVIKEKLPFPKEQVDRLLALRRALEGAGTPLTVSEIAAQFKNARQGTVQELLDLLVSLGNAHTTDDDRYTL